MVYEGFGSFFLHKIFKILQNSTRCVSSKMQLDLIQTGGSGRGSWAAHSGAAYMTLDWPSYSWDLNTCELLLFSFKIPFSAEIWF